MALMGKGVPKAKKRRKERARAGAERLAPPEEKAPRSPNGRGPDPSAYQDGSILVDSGDLHIPKDFDEDGEAERSRLFGFDPVVLVVFVLSLAFMIFVAWQISHMPPAK